MTIDWWTLGFQAVNVLVLIWLLQRFFWRPIAAMIEQRRVITATRAGFNREREAVLAGAHAEAEKASKATLEAAAKEAAAHNTTAHAAELAEHDANEAAWTGRAGELAVQIAGRLAHRLQGQAVDASFLDWMVSGIQAMPDQVRQAALADNAGFEAVSAEPLSPAAQERTRDLITKAFGAELTMTFKADPALIAGIELHGPHFALENSWRADLGQILKDIRRAPGR
jgi:F-type H+-transporting ATPase subunit b